MTDINLDLALSKSQISDLVNALEDHRDDFLRKAVEAQNGFGLDPEYWKSRAGEIDATLLTLRSAIRMSIGQD